MVVSLHKPEVIQAIFKKIISAIIAVRTAPRRELQKLFSNITKIGH